MKRISRVLGSIMLVAVVATSCTTTDSAEVTLVVDQIGNDKGIPNVQMESGFVFYFPPTQDTFTYPTNLLHKVWTAGKTEGSETNEAIKVTSADGATFGLDVALNLQLERAQAANVFLKYRKEIPEILDTRVRNIVRKALLDNAVSFASDSLLQHRNTYEAQVNKQVAALLEKEGFINSDLTVLDMEIPQSYRDAINEKVRVSQTTAKIKAQTIQAEQEALRKVAVARGNYEAAQFDAKTKEIMSAPKMLELYKAETDRMWADKGVSPWGSNNVFGANTGIMFNRS